MNRSNEKVCITSSKLFLEVSSVIGKVEALKQLTLAYREYTAEEYSGGKWIWCKGLLKGFTWDDTPQGHNYWSDIYYKVQLTS